MKRPRHPFAILTFIKTNSWKRIHISARRPALAPLLIQSVFGKKLNNKMMHRTFLGNTFYVRLRETSLPPAPVD